MRPYTRELADPVLIATTRANLLKLFAENDTYKSVRESAGWKEFEKKFY